MLKLKEIVLFIFEIGSLKRVKRSGWSRMLIDNPESVAEHVFRGTQIAYILATMEKANPERAACMFMIHDNAETRIGDLHKMAQLYLKKDEAEQTIFGEQLEDLEDDLSQRWRSYLTEYLEESTPEARIAHDADLLEMAFSIAEYQSSGHKFKGWMESVRKKLKTDSALKIFRLLEETEPTQWVDVVFAKKRKGG